MAMSIPLILGASLSSSLRYDISYYCYYFDGYLSVAFKSLGSLLSLLLRSILVLVLQFP